MERKSNSNSPLYDVIIIGSGMGGLTAGNILAKKGYKVLIIEKHFISGGCTTNFKRKEFTFDASIHLLNGCERGGMIYNILRKFNAQDSIEFIKVKEIFHWIDPRINIDLRISSDFKTYINDLVKLFPDFEKEIRKFD